MTNCLLQQSSALVVNLMFKFLVVWCLSYLERWASTATCISTDCRVQWLRRLLSRTKSANQCPTLPAWMSKIHLWRQLFPLTLAGSIKRLDEAMSGSPDFSYCCRRSGHSLFKQGIFTKFTNSSNVTDNTGMSKHRLSPYTAYYLSWLG